MTDEELKQRSKAMMNSIVFKFLRKVDLTKIQQNRIQKINEDTDFGELGQNIPATIDDLLADRDPSPPIRRFLIKAKKGFEGLINAYAEYVNIDEAFVGELITTISQQSQAVYDDEEKLIDLQGKNEIEATKQNNLISENAKYQQQNDDIKRENSELLTQRGSLNVANLQLSEDNKRLTMENEIKRKETIEYDNLLSMQKDAYAIKINAPKKEPNKEEIKEKISEVKSNIEKIPMKVDELPGHIDEKEQINQKEVKNTHPGKRNPDREKRIVDMDMQGLSKFEIAQREGVSASVIYGYLERFKAKMKKEKK